MFSGLENIGGWNACVKEEENEARDTFFIDVVW
jgi:hypothetical protein